MGGGDGMEGKGGWERDTGEAGMQGAERRSERVSVRQQEIEEERNQHELLLSLGEISDEPCSSGSSFLAPP